MSLKLEKFKVFFIRDILILPLLNPLLNFIKLDLDSVSNEKEIIKEFAEIMDLDIDAKIYNYDILKNTYNEMTIEEKNNFVIKVVEEAIQKNENFTTEEKDYLKEYQTNFLNEYGYLYDFDNVFTMYNRVDDIEVLRNQEFSSESVISSYNKIKNLIRLKGEINNESLCHGLEYAMTNNVKVPTFIERAMNSFTDLEYENRYTGENEILSQVLFLGEIIGRENLINCYLNDDMDLLQQLVGEKHLDLFNIFEQELECKLNNGYIDNELTKQAQEKLKNMYEERFNKKVSDDKLIYIIYSSCNNDSEYKISSTIFYEDEFNYKTIANYFLIDESAITAENIEYVMNVNTKKSIFKLEDITTRELEHGEFIETNWKLNNLFSPDGKLTLLYGKGTIEENLREYLKEIGITNIDFWTYNILNNNFKIAVNITGFPYNTTESFLNDLSKIYKDRFEYFKELAGRPNDYITISDLTSLLEELDNLESDIKLENISLFLKGLYEEFDTIEVLNNYYRQNSNYEQSHMLEKYQENYYLDSTERLWAMFGEEEFRHIMESGNIIAYLEEYCKDFCEEKEIPKYINMILDYSKNENVEYTHELFIDAFYQRLKKDSSQQGIVTLVCDLDEIMSKEECSKVLSEINNRLINNDNIDCNLTLYNGFSWYYIRFDREEYNYSDTKFYYSYKTNNNMITLPNIDCFYSFKTSNNLDVEIINIEYDANQEFVTYYFDKKLTDDNEIMIRVIMGDIKDLNDTKKIIPSTNKIKKKNLTY